MADQRPTILWLNAFLIGLTFTATCSRAGRRIFVVGKFSWHDALITLAAVSATIFSIFQMVGTGLGLGQHQTNVDPANMPKLGKLVVASNVFYFLCNWAVKHALLLFYSEITTTRSHIISIYIMHFVAFGFGSSSILVDIFQCRPIRKAWDSDAPGWCANMNIFFYFNSNIMLATDLVLYIMPVIFTRKLQLRKPQRIGLNCLFAMGGLVLAASAARVYSVHMFATRPDFTWRFANAMIWSVIENHLAVVVACAPSIKVIALLLFPRLASSFGKLASRVTPSGSSRSKSRASVPLEIVDLESGTRQSDVSKGGYQKEDELKPTPTSTPLPSPVFSVNSGSSRASKNFSKWFKAPGSPRVGSGSADSLEDTGLVYVEETGREREAGRDSRMDDIRVEHTISIESERHSSGHTSSS